MGDRFRIGELLAAIGVIGLGALLVAGHWFSPLPPGETQVGVLDTVSASHLGWFALLLAGLDVLAGVVYLVRVATAKNDERVMLQVPVVFALGLFTLLVLFVRVLAFPPDFDLPTGIVGGDLMVDTTVATGGWLGLVAATLIPVGTWVAMADERTGSRAAREATERLLAGVSVRPVPVGGDALPDSDASVVVDDDVPTDPSSPGPGGPA